VGTTENAGSRQRPGSKRRRNIKLILSNPSRHRPWWPTCGAGYEQTLGEVNRWRKESTGAEEEPYYHYHMYHGHTNQKQESVQNIRKFVVMLLQSRALAFLPHVAFGPRSVLSFECTPGSSSARECQPGSCEFEAFHCCLLPWEQHTGSFDGCACCLRVAIAR
jgi:hypothetical protein